MTSCINPDTFVRGEVQPDHGFWIDGTVEVTLHRETRRVTAKMGNEQITAYGLTGRYETGSKAWPARVTRVVDPTTNKPWDRIQFGRDERTGRCKKTSMIFFRD